MAKNVSNKKILSTIAVILQSASIPVIFCYMYDPKSVVVLMLLSITL